MGEEAPDIDNVDDALWQGFVNRDVEVSAYISGLEYEEALGVIDTLFAIALRKTSKLSTPEEMRAYERISIYKIDL